MNSEILWRLGQTLDADWRAFISEREQAERKREQAKQKDQDFLDQLMQDPKRRALLAKVVAGIVPKKD